MSDIKLNSWQELKLYIDEHYDDYPDLSWQAPLHEFYVNRVSTLPITSGVYVGNTDEEVAPEKAVKDLKATYLTEWTQYCYTMSGILTTGEKVGAACGPASNIFCLDIDDFEIFKRFCGSHGISMELNTMIVESRPERYHAIFQHPQDGRKYISRTKGNSGSGCDIRTDNSYILLPGSLHPITKKAYRILDPFLEPAPAPEWLLNCSIYGWAFPHGPDASGKLFQVPAQLVPSPMPAPANLPDAIQGMVGTAYPVGQRSEPVMSVVNSLVANGWSPEQITTLLMASPVGDVARQKGQSWINQTIGAAVQFQAANPSQAPKQPKLNMSHELFQTMCQFQYYFHKNSATYYAKMATDDGKSLFYDIESDAFEGKIIALQETKTVTSGSYYDFQKAKKKLASYVSEHALDIRSLTRFGKYGDAYTLYLARGNGECVMVTKTGYVIDQHPEALRNTMEDMYPIDAIELGCDGLTATNALFEALGITDPIMRDFFILWLVCNLYDDIEKPIVVLTGKEGAGKTTLASVLKSVFDPVNDKESGGLNPPDDKKEFAIELSKQGVLHIDNVTSFSKAQQNLLCQAFSNGYVAVKKLYSSGQNIRYPLSCNIIITALEIPENLRKDLDSRAVVFALPERKHFAAKTSITNKVKSLLSRVRGELCAMAAKMMACPHEYKPIGMNRWSDFDIKGQQFYDVLGNDDPVNAYRRLLKDVLRRKAKASAKMDAMLNTFIGFIEEWKLLVFTPTQMYDALCNMCPKSELPDGAPALGRKLNAVRQKLYEAGIVLIEGGKADYGHIYLAATEDELTRIGGEMAVELLSGAKAFIADLHANDITQWVPMLEQFFYPEGKEGDATPDGKEPETIVVTPSPVSLSETGVAVE